MSSNEQRQIERDNIKGGCDEDALLNQLAADDTNEARVRAVRHRTGRQRFAGARRAVQQHALGGVDAQRQKPLGVQQWELDHLGSGVELFVGVHITGEMDKPGQ